MSMINSVRETVLSLLNKNNYGYITPNDFNLYAKQAQLDIFEDYFYQYNYQINKENVRQSGTGLADITKGYEEVINMFSRFDPLTNVTTTDQTQGGGGAGLPQINNWRVPTTNTTGFDYYLINKVLYNTKVLVSSTATNGSAGTILEDTTVDFFASGVRPGDYVQIGGSGGFVDVLDPASRSIIYISENIAGLGNPYTIYNMRDGVKDVDKVTQAKATMLSQSNLTKPTEMFPVYTQNEDVLQIYPQNPSWTQYYLGVGVNPDFSSNNFGRVFCQYIRYPKDPKWTYFNLVGSEPTFNQSASDYQDFELPQDEEPTLVMKILQFAGMSIREAEAVQFGQSQEMVENQNEK